MKKRLPRCITPLHRRYRAYPAFCVLALVLAVAAAGAGALAVQRHTPEVSLVHLSGDPAQLDRFTLSFQLADLEAANGHCPVQSYTLSGRTLTLTGNSWAEEAALRQSETQSALPETLPDFIRATHPLAAFPSDGRWLSICASYQDLCRGPDPNSVYIPLDLGYTLTVWSDGQAVYRGRLATFGGDDSKRSFSMQSPDPTLLLQPGTRRLLNFQKEGTP